VKKTRRGEKPSEAEAGVRCISAQGRRWRAHVSTEASAKVEGSV